MPHPIFGFPRRGFVLSARKSPPADLDSSKPEVAQTKLENLTRLGAEAWWSAAKDATSKSGEKLGVRTNNPDGSLSSAEGLTLEFVDENGALRPAAWVAIRIHSGSRDGGFKVSATARAGSRLGEENVTVSEVTKHSNELDEWNGGHLVPLSGGFIDSITIGATSAEELELVVDKVHWIPANQYADDGEWKPLERFLLPYDGDGRNYPQLSKDVETRLQNVGLKRLPPWKEEEQTELTAEEIQARYLTNGQPRRLKGHRHLGKMLESEREVPQPQGNYRFGDSEEGKLWTGGSPNGNPDREDVKGLEVPAVQFLLGASMGTPFAHLLGLAHYIRPDELEDVIPDGSGKESKYDFKISAVYPSRWWWRFLEEDVFAGRGVRKIIQNLRNDGDIVPPISEAGALPPDDAQPPKDLVEQTSDFFRVVSFATNVGTNNVLTEEVPKARDLTVDLQDVPGKEPVPVEAVLSWSHSRRERNDLQAPVAGYMAEREENETGNETENERTVLLDVRERDMGRAGSETDDEEVLPRLINLDEEEHELRDAGLREEGKTTWNVYLMDFWGRWGDAESATETVEDKSPPPPPSGLTAEFKSTLDDPGSTDDNPVVLEFNYGEDLVNQARDLSSFEISLEEGPLGSGGGEDKIYTVEVPRVDSELEWQEATVDVEGASVRIFPAVEHPPEKARPRRIQVRGLRGPAATGDQKYHWHTTALVRAVDKSDNKSKPATNVATFVESVVEKVPVPEVDDIEYTTWPDADGLGWWQCEWDPNNFDKERRQIQEKRTRIQVLRTSGARLLAEAGKERDEVLGNLDPGAKADELRGLALENRHAFAPDHSESYHVERGYHDVAIEANSRDLHLVLVMPTGPTGERSKWPTSKDKFAVIAARPLEPVPQPRLGAHSEDVKVESDISVAGDPTHVRVWRTTRSDIVDLRKMHPLKPIELGNGDPQMTHKEITDRDVKPTTWYAYYAVAEASDGRRSSPTGPVWVKTGRPWTVTGTVVDAQTEEPLPGTNVMHVEENQGTTTDSDGTFRLDVNSRDAKLRLTFIGYETKVVPVKGRSEITVELSPSG